MLNGNAESLTFTEFYIFYVIHAEVGGPYGRANFTKKGNSTSLLSFIDKKVI